MRDRAECIRVEVFLGIKLCRTFWWPIVPRAGDNIMLDDGKRDVISRVESVRWEDRSAPGGGSELSVRVYCVTVNQRSRDRH